MFLNDQKKFYGRRKGRRISSNNLKFVENVKHKFYLQEELICKLSTHDYNKNILEIGFGNGDNLVNMSLNKPNDLFIGCDAYYNGCVKLLKKIVDLSPRGIRNKLKLNNPIYVPTSAYGHFGRKPDETLKGSFTWEKTDLLDMLKKEL